MDNASSTLSILDTLRTVEFRLGLKGYNVDEVDEYLEKAAVEAEQVQERLRTGNERLRLATERVAQLEEELRRSPADRAAGAEPDAPAAGPSGEDPGSEERAVTTEALQRTLILAQRFVEQTKRESEAEAAHVVSQAEERARTLLAEAEERARRLTTEAEERLRDEVARLEEARGRLAADVEELTRHLEDQRTQIRESLTGVLHWLDERMPVPERRAPEPGNGGGSAHRAGQRPPAGEGTVSAEGAEPGRGGDRGPGVARSGSPAGTGAGATPAQGAPPERGASERQSSPARSDAPGAAPATDRPQVSDGGRPGGAPGALFEMGREGASALEGSRAGE